MMVPLLVAAVGATSAILVGDPMGDARAWITLLVVFDIVVLVYAWGPRDLDQDVEAAAGPEAHSIGRPHLARALVQRGHVATAADAFDLLCQQDYSLALIDLRIPGTDGLSLTREVRNRSGIHHFSPSPGPAQKE